MANGEIVAEGDEERKEERNPTSGTSEDDEAGPVELRLDRLRGSGWCWLQMEDNGGAESRSVLLELEECRRDLWEHDGDTEGGSRCAGA